ncbi:hypothetical protein H7J07_05755 [Mycobacterium koreense]|uniref:hypothetical protein n=1 Tax=Mycolicibacillus koreensis TaxID=1069220 RepID=UPI00105562D8|nr:hypothetical protein [Mycolicibacillus koreensis]MCV7247730.1 hypothetical protein [Mycolicibacillus koreensis]BBY54115.1 hypothetical protein MKOR_13660 [Mycolicibacillus koreensis]
MSNGSADVALFYVENRQFPELSAMFSAVDVDDARRIYIEGLDPSQFDATDWKTMLDTLCVAQAR